MKNAFILDCDHEVKKFIIDTIDIDLPPINVEVILEDIVEILNQEDLNGQRSSRFVYWATAKYIGESDVSIQYDNEAEMRLYSAMLKLTGAIRNKLRHHHAYVDGQFPFTFTRLIQNGTFYLTRKRDAANANAHHPRHTEGGIGTA
jgi:hypothetical protein